MRLRSVYLIMSFLLLGTPAQAYIGPGAGLGAISLTIALLVGAAFLIVGFVWYPLKRLMRGLKKTKNVSTRGKNDSL